jgi:hypothetical protein
MFVCAAAVKTADKKIMPTLKLFMVLDFAAFAAIRQMQDASMGAKVTI